MVCLCGSLTKMLLVTIVSVWSSSGVVALAPRIGGCSVSGSTCVVITSVLSISPPLCVPSLSVMIWYVVCIGIH